MFRSFINLKSHQNLCSSETPTFIFSFLPVLQNLYNCASRYLSLTAFLPLVKIFIMHNCLSDPRNSEIPAPFLSSSPSFSLPSLTKVPLIFASNSSKSVIKRRGNSVIFFYYYLEQLNPRHFLVVTPVCKFIAAPPCRDRIWKSNESEKRTNKENGARVSWRRH